MTDQLTTQAPGQVEVSDELYQFIDGLATEYDLTHQEVFTELILAGVRKVSNDLRTGKLTKEGFRAQVLATEVAQ